MNTTEWLQERVKDLEHDLALWNDPAYIATQARVDALYRNPTDWQRKAVLNVAGMGKFSSDRTIRQYAEQIWRVKRVPVS